MTPWTIACQVPLSMGFSRQEYWTGLPFPSPGDLPDAGIEHGSPALQANSLQSEPQGNPGREEISKKAIKGSPSGQRKMIPCGNLFELLHSDPPSASQKFDFGNNHHAL